ncbi:MAG: NTP transferase domain-containing protein [Candidatus Bathyarchaeia archaeon]
MGVTALVMAGGKGARMALSEEKPLLRVAGKPIIEHVITALLDAKKVNNVVVAVSSFTPKTARYVSRFPVQVVITPGKDYVSDMRYAVEKLFLGSVLAIGADLPLVTGEIIDAIVMRFEQCGKPALTVVVPVTMKEKLGLGVEYDFEISDVHVVPAGINVIDGSKISEGELDDAVYIIDRYEVAVNINTVEELHIAEELFQKKRSTNA